MIERRLHVLVVLNALFFCVGCHYRMGEHILLPRPDLFDLMLSRIPAQRMQWGKRVLKIDERDEDNKQQVTITCADGSQYVADMVVGAGIVNSFS